MNDVGKYRKYSVEAYQLRYSRGIEDAVWINADKSIIEESGGQTTRNGAQDRGPEPVLTAEVENYGYKKVLD